MNLNPKVSASAVVGAVVLVVVFLLHQFAHVDLSPELVAALTLILTFAAGYLTPAGDWAPKP